MGYDANPNGSDLSIVTVVLQYSVFATHRITRDRNGPSSDWTKDYPCAGNNFITYSDNLPLCRRQEVCQLSLWWVL